MLPVAGCSTTDGMVRDIESWFKSDSSARTETEEEIITPLSLDGTPMTGEPAQPSGNLERLRRASLDYYGGLGGRQQYTPIDVAGAAAAIDPSVEIYPINGAFPVGSVVPPGGYTNVQSSYEYQSMFPELGGVSPGRATRSSAGGGGTALAPVLSSGDTPSQVFFKHGSSYLGSGDKRVLSQVAEQAKFSPVEAVTVDAYASKRTSLSDPVASAQVNLRQSMERANAVSSFLIEQGVPGEKLKTSTWGDTRLSGKNEAYDRRVDIVTGGQ